MSRLNRARAAALRLGRDEEGSSLVFAAITLFSLALCIMFINEMGIVSADRMQIQSAADAAAYSAAQVEANSLNAIGQVNDGMTYLNYLMLRFTVDAIVYDTINGYERKGATRPDYSYVLMGGQAGSYEGPARYEHAFANANYNITADKDWVQDLHVAARVITDMEQAWRIGDGFAERTPTDPNDPNAQGDRFEPSMYARYAARQVWQVDQAGGGLQPSPAAQALPSEGGGWFDRTNGENVGDYLQVRLCWNAKDWEHAGKTPDHGAYFSRYGAVSPNGHWHTWHPHFMETPLGFMFIRGHGGGGQNGEPDSDDPGGHYNPPPNGDDPSLHPLADELKYMGEWGKHHYAMPCPTCDWGTFTVSNKYAEVPVTSGSDARTMRGYHNLRYAIFPRPLMLQQALLRSGVTVAAWRRGRGLGTEGSDALFPPSPWGMLGISTAMVGYQTDDGVLPLSNLADTSSYAEPPGGVLGGRSQQVVTLGADDPRFKNLFYSTRRSASSPDGVRFGARLMPVAWENAHHPSLGWRSLGNLLGSGATRWYEVDNPGGGGNAVPQITSGGAPVVDASGNQIVPLVELEKRFAINGDEGLKAIWH
jgi:hypothetical protein